MSTYGRIKVKEREMKIAITGKYDEKWIDVDLNIELKRGGDTEESVKG